MTTRLGRLPDVNPGVIENMFASDVAFLQDLYRRINAEGHTRAALQCPACRHDFTLRFLLTESWRSRTQGDRDT